MLKGRLILQSKINSMKNSPCHLPLYRQPQGGVFRPFLLFTLGCHVSHGHQARAPRQRHSVCHATLDALNRGRQSGLCREDYCDPEIVYKVCKDWTPCKASLVAAYGEEAGLKFDDACFKGVGVFIALAVVLPICFICLGVLIGKCCLQRRSRRRGAEERVAFTVFTTAEGGVGGLTLGQLQPAQTAPHYDAEAQKQSFREDARPLYIYARGGSTATRPVTGAEGRRDHVHDERKLREPNLQPATNVCEP